MKKTILFSILIICFISGCQELKSGPEKLFFEDVDQDYELAIEEAKKTGKPILIYFSCRGCINARKMEDSFLWLPAINNFCTNEIEVITLYVDDRTKLETPFEVGSGSGKKSIKTIGQKNAHFQSSTFKNNSQPHLVFIDSNEKELISINYTPHFQVLKEFLKKGKDLFEKQKDKN